MAVFHLKYRPTKATDLDLPEVSEKIKKLISEKSSFQALLLAGPKGSGKTSAARILAKAVNCLDLVNGEACGKCVNCQAIEKGNSLDIIEIDAASNRGIDDVRALKENAYLAPVRLQKKVFIIDEVHMLTKEAFNALLKLIEEPPERTLFVLCTTDPQKIPETVLSRLLRINFRKGGVEDLERSLDKVIKGEKIEMEAGAKKIIIDNSDGSFRNLQKSFNEIVLEYGKKIKKSQVEEYFAKNKGEYEAEELEKDINKGEIKKIINRLEEMATKGVDFGELRLKWLNFFHQKMLTNLEDLRLREIVEKLVMAGGWEKISPIEQLPLEMVMIEITNNQIPISKQITKKEKPAFVQKNKDYGVVQIEEIENKWGEILAAVKPFNHSVEAFLRAARPQKIDKGELIIEVFYKFHKDKLEEAKHRQIVEKGLDKVFGEGMSFRCVLAEKTPVSVPPLRDSDVAKPNSTEKAIEDVAKEIFG
jgi:DNA polymerase-3 subunit gamma/tau